MARIEYVGSWSDESHLVPGVTNPIPETCPLVHQKDWTGLMDGRKDGWMDRRKDGWTDGRMVGWTGEVLIMVFQSYKPDLD